MKKNISIWKFLSILVAVVISMVGCTDLDEVNARLDNLELNVSNLQAAVASLQEALDGHKIVSSVTPLNDVNGWNLSFTDGTSINVQDGQNGKDGITPYLMVDQDGNWAISYDNGVTFTSLLDLNGNQVSATAKDGVDGISVRIAVNDEGYYVIQSYLSSDPDSVVDETVTAYTADASRIISSIVQDDNTHIITISLADGKSYTFNMTYVTPSGIVILAVNPIVELTSGASEEIIFRVNPSNAKFNYDVTDDACQIKLDCVNALSRSSYVKAPQYYSLSSVSQAYDEKGELLAGQYKATITDLSKYTPYDDDVCLVLNVVDGNGDEAQISSIPFQVKWSTGGLDTGLPIVYINTPDAQNITSKTEWMAGVEMSIVYKENDKYVQDYQGTLSMKGRGNSTWGYPKKPYALKLDKKDKILGMKKHKRWCLLANWMDRTLIRNAVAFEIARRTTGLAWTPSGKFVEVVFNGKHLGNYYLCEQIKVDENRVNITELDSKATEGDGITGGYIFELDTYFDEEYKFKSSLCDYPWQFKDPDEVNEAQFNYVQNFVTEMETALTDSTLFANRKFVDYMDLDSYVDWWLVYELAQNYEPEHPKSSYMIKDVDSVDGRMKAGPVWDFDWGTFVPRSRYGYAIKDALYYKYLFNDATFKALIKEHWNDEKADFQDIADNFIEGLKQELAESDNLNAAMWPISKTTNGDEQMSYKDAVDRLKTAYQGKLNWLDGMINAF